jgi:hypothetical protein
MTEVDWSEEAEAPAPKKRGIPRWIWIGCGCGCLTTLVVLAIGGWYFKQALDPEVQWPKLRQVLAFEERPTDLKLHMGMPLPGIRIYTMIDEGDQYQATVTYFESDNANQMDQVFTETRRRCPAV